MSAREPELEVWGRKCWMQAEDKRQRTKRSEERGIMSETEGDYGEWGWGRRWENTSTEGMMKGRVGAYLNIAVWASGDVWVRMMGNRRGWEITGTRIDMWGSGGYREGWEATGTQDIFHSRETDGVWWRVRGYWNIKAYWEWDTLLRQSEMERQSRCMRQMEGKMREREREKNHWTLCGGCGRVFAAVEVEQAYCRLGIIYIRFHRMILK